MSGLAFERLDDGPVQRNFDEVDRKLGVVAQVPMFVLPSGSPNGTITASPGALCVVLAGGGGVTFFVKESGVSTNLGWVGK